MLAAEKGCPDCVRALLAHGAPADARDSFGDTTLHHAVRSESVSTVQLVLRGTAAVDARNKRGQTALMAVVGESGALPGTGRPNPAVIRVLLAHHADVNAGDEKGLTPLMSAAIRGLTDVVRQLLGAGARVNSRDRGGATALVWACRYGATSVGRVLLSRGANVNARDLTGRTGLLEASRGKWTSWGPRQPLPGLVSLLLQHRADVNAHSIDGVTALMDAAREGHLGVARLLLASGADPGAVSLSGDTALSLARRYGHADVAGLLSAPPGRGGARPRNMPHKARRLRSAH
jgi:ankyrin repeat protein